MTALPRIDHIGIVVEALEPAIAAFKLVMPQATMLRRSLPDAGLEVAEFHAANVIVELLAHTSQGNDMGREVMGGEPGVNHLSLHVPDLDSALTALAAEGITPMAGFPRAGAHGRIAFLQRSPHTGLLFELCEPDAPDAARDPKP